MSFEALAWAWEVEGIDAMQRLCLLAAAEGAHYDGTLKRPAVEVLARKLHVRPSHASGLFANLFEVGLCEPSPLGEEYCRLRMDSDCGEGATQAEERQGGLR